MIKLQTHITIQQINQIFIHVELDDVFYKNNNYQKNLRNIFFH